MSSKLRFFGYCFLALFLVIVVMLDSNVARNEPISSYELIAGRLHEKGVEKVKNGDRYFIRIKNLEGDYKIFLDVTDASIKKLFRNIRYSNYAEARVLRTFSGIHLIDLKMDNEYIVRQTRT
ncbi:hypothetical protein L9G16_06985 [Shewanella sp. A25]|nr:hypothetical protein [Shewanella shenzhenensis]